MTAETGGAKSVGKRKRHPPVRFLDLSGTTTTPLERALSDSEEKLKKALALLSTSESLRAEAEVEISRSKRFSAEWRSLYLDHSAANCERYNALLGCYRAQGIAFESCLKGIIERRVVSYPYSVGNLRRETRSECGM